MARSAIFVALVASTLLGPCLCCCAFAGFASDSTIAKNPAIPATPACPHCQTNLPAGAEPSPVTPVNPTPSCPCCEEREHSVLIAQIPQTPSAGAMQFVDLMPIAPNSTVIIVAERSRWEYPPGMGPKTFLIDFCHHLRC
jgi:hypothetical protein